MLPRLRPTTNPYLIMLRSSIEAQPGVTVIDFSWSNAFFGRADVYHAHWPEILLTGRTPTRRRVREGLVAAYLTWCAVRGQALVRTFHNAELPSELTGVQTGLLHVWERATDLWIVLNPQSQPPGSASRVLIPHGHYRDWYRRDDQPATVPGRLAFFGLVRRYKGVDRLVRSFREMDDPTNRLSLEVAGKPSSEELSAELESLADGDPRVTLDFSFLSDDEIVALVGRAQLVVLPYRQMHNSGGVLTALSLDRPVLVPDNPVTRQLAQEVGPEWVQTFADELGREDLDRALTATASLSGRARPDLSQREWEMSGAEHVRAYRQAVAACRSLGMRGRLSRLRGRG